MKHYTRWSELTVKMPELKYLMPRDVRALKQLLKRQSWSITFDEFGSPSEVGAET